MQALKTSFGPLSSKRRARARGVEKWKSQKVYIFDSVNKSQQPTELLAVRTTVKKRGKRPMSGASHVFPCTSRD